MEKSNWKQRAAIVLQESLLHQHEGQMMIDVSIKVEDESFHCHKSVLAAVSPYFQAMFTSNFKEHDQKEVCIQGISSETFRDVIAFIYGKENRIRQSNVDQLLEASCMLQIDCFKNECEDFLTKEMTVESSVHIWHLSSSFSCVELANKAKRTVLENFDEIVTTLDFLSLGIQEMKELIQSDDLWTSCEDKVCEAVLSWLNHDKSNRLSDFPDLLEFVRLPLLSPEYFSQFLDANQFLFQDTRYQKFIVEVTKFHILGDRSCVNHRMKQRKHFRYTDCFIFLTTNGQCKAVKIDDLIDMKYVKGISQFPLSHGKHFAACSFSDSIYVLGGTNMMRGSNKANFVMYDRERDKWLDKPSLSRNRAEHAMVCVNKKLYVFGGVDFVSDFIAVVEAFDIVRSCWQEVGNLQVEVRRMSAAALNNKVYIFGGKQKHLEKLTTIQCFDTVTNQCTVVGNLPEPVCYTGAIAVNGNIFLITRSGSVIKCTVRDGLSLDLEILCKLDNFSIVNVTSSIFGNNLYLFDAGSKKNASKTMFVVNFHTRDFSSYPMERFAVDKCIMTLVIPNF